MPTLVLGTLLWIVIHNSESSHASERTGGDRARGDEQRTRHAGAQARLRGLHFLLNAEVFI